MIPALNNAGRPPTVVAEWCKTGSSTRRRPTWNAEQNYEKETSQWRFESPVQSYLKTTSCTSVSVAPMLLSSRLSDCTGMSSVSRSCFIPSSPPVLRETLRCSCTSRDTTEQHNPCSAEKVRIFAALTLWTNLDGGNVKILIEADGRGVSGRAAV